MTVEELERHINTQEKLNSIYLLYGEEKFLIENIVKKIKTKFGELINGINYIQIDDSNYEELMSDIITPAFGYERKLIIIKQTGIFKKEGKKKNAKLADYKKKLQEFIDENIDIINENVVLLFVEDEATKSNLLDTIQKHGIVCNFEYQKPIQIIKRLKAICNAYKVEVDEKELKYMIEICGNNMQDLINEIRKQIEYAGKGGKITKESIDKLSIKQIEAVIFDLTDNLGKRDIKEAMNVLNNLIYSKEPPQKILVTLYNHFKKIYIVKLAQKYNKDLATSMKLKPNQMFLVSKYKKQANYFKEQEVREIMDEFVNLDEKYKIGLIDLNLGLETILCSYCS